MKWPRELPYHTSYLPMELRVRIRLRCVLFDSIVTKWWECFWHENALSGMICFFSGKHYTFRGHCYSKGAWHPWGKTFFQKKGVLVREGGFFANSHLFGITDFSDILLDTTACFIDFSNIYLIYVLSVESGAWCPTGTREVSKYWFEKLWF